MENFLAEIKSYLMQKRKEQSTNKGEGSTENIDDVTVTTSDIVDFSIAKDWFHGKNLPLGTDAEEESSNVTYIDRTASDNRSYILFHCCEELELLSREYSNDEGADSSVAAGPQTEFDTEHPDYLIQKGLAQSALHRMPLPQPI